MAVRRRFLFGKNRSALSELIHIFFAGIGVHQLFLFPCPLPVLFDFFLEFLLRRLCRKNPARILITISAMLQTFLCHTFSRLALWAEQYRILTFTTAAITYDRMRIHFVSRPDFLTYIANFCASVLFLHIEAINQTQVATHAAFRKPVLFHNILPFNTNAKAHHSIPKRHGVPDLFFTESDCPQRHTSCTIPDG